MKLTNIKKTYHNKNNEVCVFQNLNLTFPNHGCITVYGESGSGKTTLFQLIAGLDKDYEGVIENHQRIEYLFQEIELFENLSVNDNLILATQDQSKIDDLLTKFEMNELKKQKVKKLSNGEKRRVQIMRSLLNEPDLLLMDEPSASLDHKNASLVCDMIKQLSKDITVVITTHDEALFDDVADRSYRIEHQQLKMIKNDITLQAENQESVPVNKKPTNIKNIFQMSALYIKAHKINTCISILLLCCFCFFAYIGFYYNDASGEKQKHNVWNYSTNLIYTFPNNCDVITNDGTNLKTCSDFDLFNLDYTNDVIDKNDDIIAYALVWDSAEYIGFDYKSMEEMYKESDQGKQIGIVENLKRSFYSYYDVFKIIEYEDESGKAATFVNPETSYLEIVNVADQLRSMGDSPRVFPYEMIDMNQLPILTGYSPKEENEVIIGNDFAEALTKVFKLENKNQLIGRKIDLSTRGDIELITEILTEDWKNKDLYLHVVISGITSYENVFENRMYFKRNAFQSMLADIYHYDLNKLNVQQEKFLIDPSKDIQTVMDNLNVNSPLVKDSYHIFNGEDNVYIDWSGKINQDQRMMKQIIAVSLIICLIFLMLHRFFFKKQLKKEAHILKQCGYSPIKIECITNLILCIITGILSFTLLILLIPLLNHTALALLNRRILDWSFIYFLYSFLFIIIAYEIGTSLYMKYLTRS